MLCGALGEMCHSGHFRPLYNISEIEACNCDRPTITITIIFLDNTMIITVAIIINTIAMIITIAIIINTIAIRQSGINGWALSCTLP